MKIQDQVCTAQQGKILVELGINAEPLFWHCINIDPITPECILQSWQHSNFSKCEKHPAFTVAELGLLLPNDCGADKGGDNNWEIHGPEIDCRTHRLYDQPSEAIGKAALLIWLLENNHTTAEECNNRLRA